MRGQRIVRNNVRSIDCRMLVLEPTRRWRTWNQADDGDDEKAENEQTIRREERRWQREDGRKASEAR